jgi:transcriptional regulator with XRE-family HTH domain
MKPSAEYLFVSELNRRRRELGLSCALLAKRTNLSLRTVQRALSGEGPVPEFSTIMALSQGLGLTLRLEAQDARAMCRRQAEEKARLITSLVQSSSALEAQALPAKALRDLHERTVHELLAGSRRRLWAE